MHTKASEGVETKGEEKGHLEISELLLLLVGAWLALAVDLSCLLEEVLLLFEVHCLLQQNSPH